MPTYEYYCTECSHPWSDFCSYEERDEPKDCEECGSSTGKREWRSFPGVMRASHAAHRRTGINEDLKEATQLEIDSYDMPVEKRVGINREITRLKQTKDARSKPAKKE